MAGVEAGLINILIGPKLVDDFGSQLEKGLDGQLEKAGRRSGEQLLQGVADGAGRAGRKLSATVTAPIVGAATLAVSQAQKVSAGLAEVATLTGQTGEEAAATIRELSGGVADLSNELGIAQTELIGGLYQAISAGVPSDNIFGFLDIAGRAAIAGVTDIETAVDGLTTVINAFGLDADQAEEVADSLFTAVKGGKTTFEELSASLFNVAPAAAAAGIDFQTVNAAIATLTAAGTPTSVATTQIRAALVGLQRPTEALEELFTGLGFETRAAAIEQLGLQGALAAVRDAAGGDAGALQQLLGSVEAVAAANVLAGTGAEKFSQELENQVTAAGATLDAFEVVDTTRDFERLKVELQNLAISFGEILLPVIREIATAIRGLVARFQELTPEQREQIIRIAAIAAAIGPALIIIGKLASSILTVIKVVRAFSAALTLLAANPIGLAIAAIALIIVGLVALYKNNEEVRRFIDEAWEKIKQAFQTAGEAIGNAITFVIEKGIAIATFFRELPGRIGDAVRRLRDAVSERLREVREFFRELPGRILGFLAELPRRLFNFGRELIRNLIDGIKNAARNIGSELSGVVRDIGSTLNPFSNIRIPGFRADGGPVASGRPYIVGERGPELIVPRTSGTVISNEDLRAAGAAGGDNYEITIMNPLAEPASLTIPRALRRAAYLRG